MHNIEAPLYILAEEQSTEHSKSEKCFVTKMPENLTRSDLVESHLNQETRDWGEQFHKLTLSKLEISFLCLTWQNILAGYFFSICRCSRCLVSLGFDLLVEVLLPVLMVLYWLPNCNQRVSGRGGALPLSYLCTIWRWVFFPSRYFGFLGVTPI